MKPFLFVFLVLVGLLLTLSCTSFFSRSNFDEKQISVRLIDLFNQRRVSLVSEKRWAGDWIFRRMRLAMVDDQLRTSRPDMIFFQESMARRGSPSESDRAIFSAGSLSGYEWANATYRSYPDTRETESLAFAVDRPLRFHRISEGLVKSWSYGENGAMAATVIDLEGEPFASFSVRMPTSMGRRYIWYDSIRRDIVAFLQRESICAKRIIVAGYLPNEQGSTRFAGLLDALDLDDSALGFCAAQMACVTETPVNDLYVATSMDRASRRTLKVLVPRSSKVTSSERILDRPRSGNKEYFRRFGLRESWAVRNFGWAVQLQLVQCKSKEPAP